MYKGVVHTKTSVSAAGGWAGWPKLCRTQLPHRSRDHRGGTRHRGLDYLSLGEKAQLRLSGLLTHA